MDHDIDLAFNLVYDAAWAIQEQQYGISTVHLHHQGDDVELVIAHRYSRAGGHVLTVLARCEWGARAALEVTADDLDSVPRVRIVRMRVGDLMFHAVPGAEWTWRAHGEHTYVLSTAAGESQWTLTVDDEVMVGFDNPNAAAARVLDGELALV
ncbi:MAG: hypothetical protein AB7G47_10175 [Mycolicibacterium sp.]|uniref:hypothetical protein n=1 Tax=Mycolicibacterium sp. TaxID=2320850 RepID=UPI003D0E0B63